MLSLEFLRYVPCSLLKQYQLNIVETLDTDTEQFLIEDLQEADCLFYAIRVSPKTLRILFENTYEFPKHQAEFTQKICLMIDNEISKETCKHLIYLSQQLYQFRKVEFKGVELKFDSIFHGIKSVLKSEFHQKIMFEYTFITKETSASDDIIEVPILYTDNVKLYDYTKIQLPMMKL